MLMFSSYSVYHIYCLSLFACFHPVKQNIRDVTVSKSHGTITPQYYVLGMVFIAVFGKKANKKQQQQQQKTNQDNFLQQRDKIY